MKTYEYTTIYVWGGRNVGNDTLNNLGNAGWELVTSIVISENENTSNSNNYSSQLIFKREKNEK